MNGGVDSIELTEESTTRDVDDKKKGFDLLHRSTEEEEKGTRLSSGNKEFRGSETS